MTGNNELPSVSELSRTAFIDWARKHKKYEYLLSVAFVSFFAFIEGLNFSLWHPIMLLVVSFVCGVRMQKFFRLHVLKELALSGNLDKETEERLKDRDVWKGFPPLAVTLYLTSSLTTSMLSIIFVKWVIQTSSSVM